MLDLSVELFKCQTKKSYLKQTFYHDTTQHWNCSKNSRH
jgi:hypothetical protein